MGGIALAALVGAGAGGYFIGHGGGPPSARHGSGNGAGAGGAGPHGSGGPSGNQANFRPGPVRYFRAVTLPPSQAPAAVRSAFAARRYSSGPPREAGRVHSPQGPVVLWVSPAYGGGWCQGLEQPRVPFSRVVVACQWPRSWMGQRIDFTGYLPKLFFGRVPQRSARTLSLSLSNGGSLPEAIRSGFFLFLIPDPVLAHAAPRALIAKDAQGRLVAREPLGQVGPPLVPFGGITRPPGGAELKHKRLLVARETPVGEASLWAAPSFAAPARCVWLRAGRLVYGGSCRRYRPPGRGLLEVVPLRLRIKGQWLSLLWGQVGRDVARLELIFQDGSRTSIRPQKGVFLYPVPSSRWRAGHRPAFLVARNGQSHVLRKRLLYEYTLASG